MYSLKVNPTPKKNSGWSLVWHVLVCTVYTRILEGISRPLLSVLNLWHDSDSSIKPVEIWKRKMASSHLTLSPLFLSYIHQVYCGITRSLSMNTMNLKTCWVTAWLLPKYLTNKSRDCKSNWSMGPCHCSFFPSVTANNAECCVTIQWLTHRVLWRPLEILRGKFANFIFSYLLPT